MIYRLASLGVLALLLALVPVPSSARWRPSPPPRAETGRGKRPNLRPLLDAICWVESRGRANAVGDGGRSIGPYQIQRAYWQDAVSHIPAIGGRYEDVRDRRYAEAIILSYWDRYAREALRRGDYEVLARVHNGGPRGHRKAATLAYWYRVRRALQTQPRRRQAHESNHKH